ncbi:hypothetical protein PL321_18425 [Caloramator sp. mosi_1]|uniref:hypothetical protein n=1 Tax=Caloramator sp. mosi_1 TaxID=3023090 RepID=UPI00235F7492|nr:hypothetical protein [Caloramator sp. mosi_1]WDC84195.1 hypothetical protein PL321_18425 [Caloramator sp. mosi_1]
MEEISGTIHTVQITMEKMGNELKYAKGMTYIKSLLLIFPNIGGILDNILYTSTYGKMLNVPYIGGSYIGEIYYNFGFFYYTSNFYRNIY